MKLTKYQARKKRRYYIIYKITNKINGLVYIGQHRVFRGFPEDDGYAGSGTKIKKAELEYGIKNFSKEILHRVSTIREANNLEIKEIKRYDSTNPEKGYNIQKGGNVYANSYVYVPGANRFIKRNHRTNKRNKIRRRK